MPKKTPAPEVALLAAVALLDLPHLNVQAGEVLNADAGLIEPLKAQGYLDDHADAIEAAHKRKARVVTWQPLQASQEADDAAAEDSANKPPAD